jgi:hypothetical protein
MIVQAYVRHVLDVYHNRPHAGLGGETPADAWDRLVSEYGVSPLPGRDTVRAVFGTEVKRVVGPHGVRVFGLHYQSRDLQVWHRETKAALAVRFAAGAKIREPHLLDAIRAAQAMAQKGLGIFGLSEPWSTPEAINRAERNLDMGWIMPGDESADTDPLDRAVPATGPEVAWPEPEPLAGTPLFRDAAEGVDDLPQVHDADEGSTKGRRAPRAAGADTSGPAPHRITWIED